MVIWSMLTRINPRVERVYRYPSAQAGPQKAVVPGGVLVSEPRVRPSAGGGSTPPSANIARLVTPVSAIAGRL
jgi:hypothetical protein